MDDDAMAWETKPMSEWRRYVPQGVAKDDVLPFVSWCLSRGLDGHLSSNYVKAMVTFAKSDPR